MSGFKKLKQTDKLVLKQRGGVVVFLESGEDFEIVHKRWFFNEGQDIWFQPADGYELGTGGGGCKAVIALVTEARAYGINAFGLVDRDVLLSDQNWPLWWQELDQIFLSARPYGDHIRVLLRWELENYLLDPDAMRIEANDAALTSRHTAESVLTSCFECVDELKDRTSATVAAKEANLPSLEPGFGCNPVQHGSDLTTALQGTLSKKGHPDAAKAMSTARQKIDKFDSPAAPPRKRWEHLMRMLDGKAALKYISHRTGIRFDERRAGLARQMYQRGTIPAEILGYIEDFKNAA